eukprot:518633-Rhodomonas_salina.4
MAANVTVPLDVQNLQLGHHSDAWKDCADISQRKLLYAFSRTLGGLPLYIPGGSASFRRAEDEESRYWSRDRRASLTIWSSRVVPLHLQAQSWCEPRPSRVWARAAVRTLTPRAPVSPYVILINSRYPCQGFRLCHVRCERVGGGSLTLK